MTVLSGRFALVGGISTNRGWTLEDNSELQTYSASNIPLGMNRACGVRSWNGSYRAFGASPLYMPGESFSFSGFTAPDSGVSGGAGYAYEGTAYVNQVVINWSWSGGDTLISHEVSFAGHLALTPDAAKVFPTDATAPAEEGVCASLGVFYDALWAGQLADVKSIQLTLTNSLQAYVNSSTVLSNVIWTGQTPGVNDWTAAIQLETHKPPLAVNSIYPFKFDVNETADPTDTWELTEAIISGYSGITADRETGAILGMTMNLGMRGHDGTTLGSIKPPGASNFWP